MYPEDENVDFNPLIVAVILIAVTLILAGVVSYWASRIFHKELEELQTDRCRNAQMSLQSGDYNKTSKLLNLVVESKSDFDLDITGVYLFYEGNNFKALELSTSLLAGRIRSLTFSDVEDNFVSGKVKTNCASASLDFTYSNMVE